jgi:outer membrane receptor protein involved in Fe transport
MASTLVLGTLPAQAQSLEEILVTAQKRVQSVQDIPISISTVSGDDMAEKLVTDIFDLRVVVPALEIRAVDPPSQGTSFAIRGLGTSVFNMGFEPTVATFIDGVYRSRSGLVSGSDLVDMARVEVLKGPQGTLFGKNSTGGVVSFYTNAPVLDETSGQVQLNYEEYNTVRANGILNLPLVKGKAAARIVASISEGDGWLDNIANGSEIHDRSRWNIRGQLLFQPNDDLSIRLIGDYAELDEKCCTPLRYENDPRSGAVNGPLAASIGSTIVDPADIDDLEVALNADPSLDAEDAGLSAEINWTLGGVTLTSITAWRSYEDEGYKDNDFTGVDVLLSNQSLPDVSLFSQELRLAGDADLFQGLDWTVGAYYAEEDIEVLNEFIWGQQGVITSNAKAYGAAFEQNGETIAAFAHGILNLTDRLSVTAGLRYTEDDKDGSLRNEHPLVPVPFPPFEIPAVFPLPVVHDYDAETSDSDTTGTLSVQYNWTDELMTYAGYSTGFKSGGISMTRDAAGPFLGFTPTGPVGPFPPVDPTFEKETADSIEAGIKSTLMGGRMRLNAAIWLTQFDDLQVQVLNPEGNFAVTNVAGAESSGVEVDGDFAVSDYLTLTASVQYVDAKYDDDVGGLTTPIPVGGERLPFVSDWTGSIGFSYDRPLGERWNGFVSGNIFLRTDYLADPDPALDREQDGYNLVNLRAGMRTSDDTWEFAAWCRNCGDERIVNSQFQIPFDGAVFFPHSTTWSHVGAPRILGVTGTYRF